MTTSSNEKLEKKKEDYDNLMENLFWEMYEVLHQTLNKLTEEVEQSINLQIG